MQEHWKSINDWTKTRKKNIETIIEIVDSSKKNKIVKIIAYTFWIKDNKIKILKADIYIKIVFVAIKE